jgi:CHAT domain-containing protein
VIGDAPNIPDSLNNLGSCYRFLGQYEKAIEHHTRALELFEKIGNPQHIARSLGNLGSCYFSLGQYEKAIEHHTRALELSEKMGNLQDIAGALDNLGSCYQSLGQYEKAIEHHTSALELFEKVGNPQSIARSLAELARSEIASAHPDLALNHFEESIAALGGVGRRTLSEEGRAAFAESWAFLSAEVSRSVRDLIARPDFARAIERGFSSIESLPACSTLEALQERAEHALEQYDPALTAERARVLNHMTELRLQLVRETSQGEGEANRLAELRTTLGGEEKALEKLEEDLRRSNPRLGQLIAPKVASLAEVQKGVLQNDQALLLFVLGKNESFAWVITQTGATIVTLPDEDELRRQYDLLQSSLTDIRDDRFIVPARDLFQKLLAPIWPALEGKSHLIIIPDGFLALLPFEVLLTREPAEEDRSSFSKLPYLLLEKSVRYAPSASILLWFAEHDASDHSWQKEICLFGDPVYGNEPPAETPATHASDGIQVPRLPKARQEVLTIAESLIGPEEADLFLKLRDLERSGHVSGQRFDLYVGDQASKVTLVQDLSGYRIVHLAVHGYFDEEFPWFSGLVLSNSPAGDSGFLTQAGIATLKLNAQIVFLSTGDTAKGRLVKADGIRNTARAFLLAGARSVVATLWAVSDNAAPILAETFYQRLFAGESSEQALREAKIALIEQRAGARGAAPIDDKRDEHRWAHPSFWAPFVLFGGG